MIHWLCCWTGTWHAWRHGSRSTLCGRISSAALLETPATDIQITVPPEVEARACKACRQRAAAPVPADLDECAKRWLGFLHRHLAEHHARRAVTPDDLAHIARLLADIGPPGDPAAVEVYDRIRELFLTPWRVQGRPDKHGVAHSRACFPHLRATLAALPPRPKILAHVAATLSCWRRITGREIAADRFRLDRVVSVIAALPDPPDPYVQVLAAQGQTNVLAACFHPLRLKALRLAPAGYGGAESRTAYAAQLAAALRVVTE